MRTNKKIKVAQVITRMIVGGAQENTLYTARKLGEKENYDLVLITGPGLGPEGNLLETLRPQEPFQCVVLGQLRRAINPFRDLIAFIQLFLLFRKEHFDVVHTHSSKAGILGRWAAWLAAVPVRVHTVHGWGFHPHQPTLRRGLYVFLEKITAPITNRLITVSNENTKKGVEAGIGKKEQYQTIYSGIEIERFKKNGKGTVLKEKHHIPRGKVIIGTIGRLAEQKNPVLFVRLASRLRDQEPNCFFVMVGDGPMRKTVEEEIERLGLKNDFLLPGLQKQVHEWVDLIDYFVITSKWEGLPRVLLQNMAAGNPVVASRTDGIEEVIRDGGNGLLLQTEDPAVWAEKVAELIHEKEKAKRLALEASKCVTEKFSDVKMVQDLDHLFLELTGKQAH